MIESTVKTKKKLCKRQWRLYWTERSEEEVVESFWVWCRNWWQKVGLEEPSLYLGKYTHTHKCKDLNCNQPSGQNTQRHEDTLTVFTLFLNGIFPLVQVIQRKQSDNVTLWKEKQWETNNSKASWPRNILFGTFWTCAQMCGVINQSKYPSKV